MKLSSHADSLRGSVGLPVVRYGARPGSRPGFRPYPRPIDPVIFNGQAHALGRLVASAHERTFCTPRL